MWRRLSSPLLSAGTLATLGMVTASEIRDIGPSRPDSRPADTLRQPGAVRVTEPAVPTEPAGTGRSGGGRNPAGPAVVPVGPVLLPELGSGGTPGLSTAGPGTPSDPAPAPEPPRPDPDADHSPHPGPGAQRSGVRGDA